MLTSKELSHIEILGLSKSMAEAAAKAAISTSAMSQSLNNAESKLQTQLFIRSRGLLIPTRAGKVVLRRISALIHEMDALHIELNDLVVSEKRTLQFSIGPAVADLVLKGVLNQICAEPLNLLPRFRVDFWDTQESRLLNHEIDIFIGGFPREPTDARFHFEPFYKDNLVAVARHDHPVRHNEVVNLDMLVHYPIMSFSSNLDTTWQALDSSFGLELFRRNVPASVMPDPMKYLDLLANTNHVLLCPSLNWARESDRFPELSSFRVEPLRGMTHMNFVTLNGIENSDALQQLKNACFQQLANLPT